MAVLHSSYILRQGARLKFPPRHVHGDRPWAHRIL